MKKFRLFFILFTCTVFSASSLFSNKVDSIVINEIDSLNSILPQVFLRSTDSGMVIAKKSLRLSELNDYERGRIKSLQGIAVFQNQMGNYVDATDYINSALRFAEKSEEKRLIADVLYTKGYIEGTLTQYDKAFEDYSRAAKLYLELGDSSRYGFVVNNMGNLHHLTKEIDLALKSYKEARKISLKYNTFEQIIATTINIGAMFGELHKFDSALFYYEKAMEIVDPSDFRHKTYMHHGLGEIYLNIKDFEKAEKYNKQGIELAKQWGNNKMIGMLTINLGKSYLQQGSNTEAIEVMLEGYNFMKEFRDYSALYTAAENLANAYKQNNNYEEALKYTNIAAVYNDSVKSKKNTERLSKLRATQEYETRMLEKELKYKRRITLVILVSGIFALIILLIIRGYIRQRKIALNSTLTKEELEKDLKQKDVDLLTKTMHLNEKEELIAGLEEKLKQLGRDLKPSKMKGIQELITEIRISKSENIWEEFESRFNSVNDDFLDRLKVKFPGLTPKELRLCSLLRLNLSTKEISTLTHQNPLSINKARFRLRKKLDLNNTDINLTSYLIDF